MSRQTIEFVDGPVYPPAALDHRRIQRSTSTGTGSSSYYQQNRLASFHQRSTLSDRSSVATDFNYPPNLNRAGSVGSRYTRTVRPGRCSIMTYLHFPKHGLWWPVVLNLSGFGSGGYRADEPLFLFFDCRDCTRCKTRSQ